MSILLDAGPSLNFFAVGQQNILIQVAESQKLRLAAPARVDSEIVGMNYHEAGRHDNWIVGGLTWEQVYDQMVPYDDGLLPRAQWPAR